MRKDEDFLLSATGGSLFNSYCLRPDYNLMQCDIRVSEDKRPLLDGTKCVLLCGEHAMHSWLPETKGNTVGEMRGSPFIVNGIIYIPTFFPQDAADFKSYEQQLNPLSKEYAPDAGEYGEDEDEGDVKRHGKTARRNYAFWMRVDTNKAKRILYFYGKLPKPEHPEPVYHIGPNSTEVIQLLSTTKNQTIWFDIETDYEDANLQCFAFSFDGINIYSVPILDYNYKFAYDNYYRIMLALSEAIRDNTLVAHNGASFDFFVLGYKYHIAVNTVYDTMLAQHRCYPDLEKSLGHCVSLWTFEKFHKDEDSHGYMNRDQMTKRLAYCAKDVRTMFLVHKAIEAHSRTIPGLQSSIINAMNCIRPYLITSLQGIRYDAKKVQAMSALNDQKMMQLIRVINVLIGENGLKEIKSYLKGKSKKSLAGSNTQCCAYFYSILGYPPIGKKSEKSGSYSLGKSNIYKLTLKHNNPIAKLIIAYRILAKSYGTLQFTPWKDDNNRVIDFAKWEREHAQ